MNFQVYWDSDAEKEAEPNHDNKVTFQEVDHEQDHS
jgi:hypothetical protein